MKSLLSLIFGAFVVLSLSGCGGKEPFKLKTYNDTGEDIGKVDIKGGWGFRGKTAVNSTESLLALETLRRGYGYFAYTENIIGLPFTSSEEFSSYCSPERLDKKTSLEKDRCYKEMGWPDRKVHFFKNRPHIISSHDAQEIVNKLDQEIEKFDFQPHDNPRNYILEKVN